MFGLLEVSAVLFGNWTWSLKSRIYAGKGKIVEGRGRMNIVLRVSKR
jgi:hypothetical protein